MPLVVHGEILVIAPALCGVGWSMRARRVLSLAVVLLSVVLVPVARAQQPADYSGTWIAIDGGIEILERRDNVPGGWGNVLAGLSEHRDYQVTIDLAPRDVAIRFPGSTFLNVGSYHLDSTASSQIKDMGDYWRKTVTTAEWRDGAFRLGSRTLVGWWRDARPEDVQRQETELSTIQVLRLEQEGTQLVIDTTVADEKGTASYRMRFSKAARQ